MLKSVFISKLVLFFVCFILGPETWAESERQGQNYLTGPFIGLGVSYERTNIGWDGTHTIYQELFNETTALFANKDPANKVTSYGSATVVLGYLQNLSEKFYWGAEVSLDFLHHKNRLSDIHTFHYIIPNTLPPVVVRDRFLVQHHLTRTFLGSGSLIVGYMVNNCLALYGKIGGVMARYRQHTTIENLDDAGGEVVVSSTKIKNNWGVRPAFGWLYRMDHNWALGGEFSWDVMRSWTLSDRDPSPNLTYTPRFRPNAFAFSLRLTYHF